ncbi:hypothetical protein P152DRAFT_456078 [Eremomyces bilateralis CBS 781.70]|uniref:Homeobox domain-containing protein n=1 Tax=Eremomyces bilateralis CBS 781.70 TaxID=1392243 RepID=A0A6G1GAV9_9PEZI|nr:uncharacterized protein P152DRAFT_456078 [Eremomyces bilateralis CBS 781.70]KAF1815040.1 hypothetical protein P152DRAFT_456078 [Eremomyces bilateralis CBS 781.70]
MASESSEDKEIVLTAGPNVAFLNHSQDTLLKQLPPDVDNKPLVRQKRRRTSPSDQKVLEDEYQRNPKPDRATRTALAQKVALGQKELQIWFQNRRQSDRRRSRPIPDDEKSSNISLHSESDRSSDLPPSCSSESEDMEQVSPTNLQSNTEVGIASERVTDGGEERREFYEQDTEQSLGTTNVEPGLKEESQDSLAHPSLLSSVSFDSLATIPSSQEQPSQETQKHKPGYIANRRGASFLQQERAYDVSQQSSTLEPEASSNEANGDEESQKQRSRVLQRSTSLRLSTTADGQARIIDENNPSPSPSPPRVTPPNLPSSTSFTDPPIRPPQLRRSLSAASPSIPSPFPTDSTTRKLTRTESGHGRSRDSRAWTFWCDAEERSSLQTQAQAESSGSAASAIGLIRERRRTAEVREKQAAQKAASRKRGLAESGSQGQNKRSKTSSDARPGLQRSQSSVSRLQSSGTRVLGPKAGATNITPSASRANAGKDGKKLAKPGEIQIYALDDSDGDKENWVPGTRIAAPRHPNSQPHAPSFGAHPLGENLREVSEAVGFGTPAAKKARNGSFSAGSSASEEVDRPLSVGSGDDLDCVEGLLKLRGGTWV